MNDIQWFIYVLIDPRSQAVRYVGWTINPDLRLRQHIWPTARDRTHKANWIRQLRAIGLKPIMQVIDSGQGEGWPDVERRHIAAYRAAGADLTNMTSGGDGLPGCRHTAESRAKIRASSLGRRLTPEQCSKIRDRVISPETCAKISAARKNWESTKKSGAADSCMY